MRCEKAIGLLVVAADGEIGPRARRALDRHLAGCASCRAEQVSTENVLACLRRLPRDAAVPAALEQRVLRTVRVLAADDGARGARTLWDRLRGVMPALAAASVVAVAVVGIRGNEGPLPGAAPAHEPAVATPAPAPPAVVRRGRTPVPDEPPAELAAEPDLFVDLDVVRDLERLRHFDAIAGMEAEDPAVEPVSPERSNG
jgi:hypothetical protein